MYVIPSRLVDEAMLFRLNESLGFECWSDELEADDKSPSRGLKLTGDDRYSDTRAWALVSPRSFNPPCIRDEPVTLGNHFRPYLVPLPIYKGIFLLNADARIEF